MEGLMDLRFYVDSLSQFYELKPRIQPFMPPPPPFLLWNNILPVSFAPLLGAKCSSARSEVYIEKRQIVQIFWL